MKYQLTRIFINDIIGDMSKEPLVIYWAPMESAEAEDYGAWNMMYPDPKLLMHELMEKRNKEDKAPRGFLQCPAAANRFKHTYVFRNGMRSEIEFDVTDSANPYIQSIGKTGVNFRIDRPSAFTEGASFAFMQKYLFFAEEPVMGVFNTPMMHRPQYTQYGTLIPGAYDISSWFRPMNVEIQTWDSRGRLILEDGEPLFYFEVLTDREIVMKRFTCNKNLIRYAESCADAPKWYGQNLPLAKRYDKFKQSKMNKVVLKEIKDNLVD
jgi:hypothetical protein